MTMQLEDRIAALAQLGQDLESPGDALEAVIRKTQVHNPWFTVENIHKALRNIRTAFLQKELLEDWAANYALSDTVNPRKVALVLAGNIPLVGFHDLLCVFITGHTARVKLSEKDKFLIPLLVQMMAEKNPGGSLPF